MIRGVADLLLMLLRKVVYTQEPALKKTDAKI